MAWAPNHLARAFTHSTRVVSVPETALEISLRVSGVLFSRPRTLGSLRQSPSQLEAARWGQAGEGATTANPRPCAGARGP